MRKYIIFISILLISHSNKLYSCNCISKWPVQEAIHQSDAVLVGTILKKEPVILSESIALKNNSLDSVIRNSPVRKLNIVRYVFLIQDIYKHYHGAITKDTVTIYSGRNEIDWGFNFEVGKKYVVYAENESYFGKKYNGYNFPKANNVYWTNRCWRTTEFNQGEADSLEQFVKKYKFRPVEPAGDAILSGDEKHPQLIGNYDEFIRQNLSYPLNSACISGMVQVQFLVDTFGNVEYVKVIGNGLTPEANEAAIRVVKLMTFKPGSRYNKPAKHVLFRNIRFRIKYEGSE